MISRRATAGLLGLSLVAALLPAVLAAPRATDPSGRDPFLARAFEVRYRPLADAADLVGPLLSPEGTLTLRPRLKVLVVEDRVSVLDRVESLLRSFDLPPKNVEVTFSLVLGTNRHGGVYRRNPGRAFSKEVTGVIETLGNFTKWVAFEPLGSRSVNGLEGDEVAAVLSDEYRVVFAINSVDEATGKVEFRRVSLQRLKTTAEGEESVENLYTAGMVVTAGKMHVVGAARDPNSNRALFLILNVKAR